MKSPLHGKAIKLTQRVLAQSQMNIHAEMKTGLGVLATIAATAPFIGLFGTVVGIMNAFRGYDATPAVILAATTAGISEALVSSALGLLVAVPACWAYNYFASRLEVFDAETANASLELVGYLITRRWAR